MADSRPQRPPVRRNAGEAGFPSPPSSISPIPVPDTQQDDTPNAGPGSEETQAEVPEDDHPDHGAAQSSRASKPSQRPQLGPPLGQQAFHGIAEPADADRLPQLPGYEMQGIIGRGGMGVIYLARQLGAERQVAIKMILAVDPSTPVSPELYQRFRIESQALARLQHPNIVQVFEVGEYRGRPFFSMEYCPGGSLSARLKGSGGTPWDAYEAAALVRTLASAMKAAHRQDIIHRDLKPGNILLDAEGRPKITDFGLAKRLDDALSGQNLTASGAMLGTPSYMAPEQAGRTRQRIGPPADIYALGAILYQLLTGRPPFQGATPVETVFQVLQEEPASVRSLRPGIHPNLEAICLKCLQKDPLRRYPSAEDLADDLSRFLDGAPVAARRLTTLGGLGGVFQKNPLAAGLGLGLLMGCLLLGGALLALPLLKGNQQKPLADPLHPETPASIPSNQALEGESTQLSGSPVLQGQNPRLPNRVNQNAADLHAGPQRAGVDRRSSGESDRSGLTGDSRDGGPAPRDNRPPQREQPTRPPDNPLFPLFGGPPPPPPEPAPEPPPGKPGMFKLPGFPKDKPPFPHRGGRPERRNQKPPRPR